MTGSKPISFRSPSGVAPPPSARRVLTVVHAFPGIRAAEVSAALELSQSACALQLSALRALGFVKVDTTRAFDGWASTGAWNPDTEPTADGFSPEWPRETHSRLDYPVQR